MALTQEQIDSFHLNGYLVYGKILDDDEIALYREQYDFEIRKAAESKTIRNLSSAVDEKGAEKAGASARMLQMMQMCERNIHFRRLIYNEKILNIVEDLIGPNIQLFHDQALFKPAHDGGAITWHQDNSYWKCRPANLVSCWLTLDDVDRSNGAMQLIPGSHLTPRWHDRSKDGTILLEAEGIDESKAVCVELPAGGCMFHHCQTLHHTDPNLTPRQRRAFAIHFMPPGTFRSVPQSPGMPVGFKHPLLRARV